MMLLRNFNRLFTITQRTIRRFGDPVVAPISSLEFPRSAILHYLPTDVTEVGPSQNLPYLEKTEKFIGIRHHTTLDPNGTIGRPRPLTTAINRDILQYHRVNKRVRRLREEKALDDTRVLFVENYSPLNMTYTYPATVLSWYDRWYNVMNTFIKQLTYDATTFNRQNYVIVEVPNTLPAINRLRLAENKRDNVSLKEFHEDSKLFLLELWTWLGLNRESSIFDRIPEDVLGNVNIILTFHDRFINLNLGELNNFRKTKTSPGLILPRQMQLRLYKTMTVMASAKLEVKDTPTPEEEADQKRQELLGLSTSEDEKLDGLDNDDDFEEIKEDIRNFDQTLDIDEDEDVQLITEPTEKPKIVQNLEIPRTLAQAIEDACNEFIESSSMTQKEYQAIQEKAIRYQSIPNPYGEGTVADMMTIAPEKLVVGERQLFEPDPTILDPNMLKSTTVDYEERYNKDVIYHDIVSTVASIQLGGVLLNDYNVEQVIDASGGVEIHTLRVQPIGGEPSTLRFQLPIIDERGYWESNDIRYTYRKQRIDVPIRKTAPDTVTLTSFYGKNFIQRSEKSNADYETWLQNQIVTKGSNIKDNVVTHMQLNDVFDPKAKLPRIFTTIARRISSFTSNGFILNFNHKLASELYPKEIIDAFVADDLTPVGKSHDAYLAMDMNSNLYRKTTNALEEIGTITDFLNIDTSKCPKPYTELSYMGKTIPLGIIFGFYLGIEGLLELYKVRFRRYEPNERIDASTADIVLKFRDGKLALEYDNFEQALIFNSFNHYESVMKNYTVRDFNSKDVYLNMIQKNKLTIRYLNELELMDQMFVDPMTKRILIKMNEPTTFKGLLRRSNELLTLDYHPKETQMDYQHIIGNQRIPGRVYTELVRTIRQFRNKPGSRKRLEMQSNAVFSGISKDGAVLPAQDANPIQSIKESDVVTFGGDGGRSRRSMVKHTRAMSEEELGVISGDTVDSGDVAITAYMSSNPCLADVDGMVNTQAQANANINQLLSAPCLLAPGILYDDDKRANFVGIQHGSATFATGYTVTGYRTGYEKVVAHRTGPSQANSATGNGEVIDVTPTAITIKYEGDEAPVQYQLGRTFGRHEGSIFPHEIATTLKAGDTVKAGDIVNYNSNFFTPDIVNPRQVNWLAGVMLNTAMLEGTDCLEDSSAISEKASGLLTTKITKVKNISARFDQAIHDLVKVGQHVDADTILCVIEDAVTANLGSFGEDSVKTLRNLAAMTPKAKLDGVVDKIEVFYNGTIEDMSESVAAIAKMGDRDRKRQAKVSARTLAQTGAVDSTLRIDGIPVELDTIVVRVYISHDVPAIGGDKAVFANQMKTTFRRVLTGVNETESGLEIDAIFGRKSIDDRIVFSVYKIGTTNKLCQLESDELCDILREEGLI